MYDIDREPKVPPRACMLDQETRRYETPQTFVHWLFSFKGRITRRQFWGTNLLFVVLPVLIVAGFVAQQEADWFVLLVSIYYFWTTTALVVKRYHDREQSGWNYLWALIPILGAIFVLVEVFQKGTDGPNRYGQVPGGWKNDSH